jgi:hypothetical protein
MNLSCGLRCCLLLSLLAISPVQADDADSELAEARTIFLQAVDGDKRAVRSATNRFRSLSRSQPKDPVYLAYYGASLTLQGRDAANNIDKKSLTEKGLGVIDQALKLLSEAENYPSSRRLDTLLVATSSFVYIPSFFNRYARGKGLLQEILSHHDFNDMAAGFKAATYFTAALVARGDGDDNQYRRYLELTVNTEPRGRDGRFATALLDEL